VRFLLVHPVCFSFYTVAARFALRKSFSPRDWDGDVIVASYERTMDELSKHDWRATVTGVLGHFGPWMRRFALNRCREVLDEIIAAQSYRTTAPNRVPATDVRYREFPDRSGPKPEEGELLAAASEIIKSLAFEQRYVFLHRTQEDETWETIAAALGVRVGRARVLFDQALHAVRQSLARLGWPRSSWPD
jgi:hypothetical protein